MAERLSDPQVLEAQRQMLADSGVPKILARVLSSPEFLSHHGLGLADTPVIVTHVDPVAGYCLTSRWPVDSSSGYMSYLSPEERAERDLHQEVSIRPDIGLRALIVGGTPVYAVVAGDFRTLERVIEEVCRVPAVVIRSSANDPTD